MGCTSCSTGGCGSTKTKGCNSNGGCSTGGCNRLNVFDWLGNMDLPSDGSSYDIVEVRFKGGRKEFFRNVENIDLTIGDPVVVDVPNGHHMGFVSLTGELVKLQQRKKPASEQTEIRTVYRLAADKDIDKYEQTKARELPTLYRARQVINDLKLEMKLSDIEFQADNTKATFYYSADDRVDFRELIKVFAGEFKIRVEMKQISLRQEAGRLGGIGVCGRELCCSTWLTDFKNVATSAARYQNLSLNPAKLSGQCGRLKCCLNYELETYMDALKDIPTIEAPLLTEKGNAYLQKTDIFRKIMWFGYKEDSAWIPLKVEKVNEILELNKKGIKPAELQEEIEVIEKVEQPYAENLGMDIEKIDDKYSSKRSNNKKKKKKKPNSGGNANAQGGEQNANQQNNPNRHQNQGGGQQQPKQQGGNHPPRQKTNHPNQGGQGQKPAGQQGGEQQPKQNNPNQNRPNNQNQQRQHNRHQGGGNRNNNGNRPNNGNQQKPKTDGNPSNE